MVPIIKSKEKKRFVIYTRCSTDDQAQGDFTTLDAQAHHCKNMMDAFGYELATKFGKNGVINDDGYSGKDLNRPGIQSILENIHKQKNKAFDGIIFFRLDRLTRNPRDLYSMIDLFKEKEIDFLSVRENLDSSTAIGRVVIGIIGLLSAFERELTGERVKASAIARARQGKWVGGKTPFGYKLVKNGAPLPNGRQPHKIEIDEPLAPYLKTIYEMAADNRTLSEIGNFLLNHKVPTAKSSIWRKQTVAKIIKNPFYKGVIAYAGEKHKGHHPAIVEEDLWEAANRAITSKLPKHRFTKKAKDYFPRLKRLARCGKCGSFFVTSLARGQGGKAYYYYECSRARQNLGCDAKRISASAFDQAVIDFFRRASTDQQVIVESMVDAVKDSTVKVNVLDKEITSIHEELNKNKKAAEELLNLAIEKTISKGVTYAKKMNVLEQEIAALEAQLSKVEAQRQAADISMNSGQYLYETLRFAMQYLDEAPCDAQIALLKALVRVIDIYDDHVMMRLYVGQPLDELPCRIDPEKQGTLPDTSDISTGQSSPGRPLWRRGRDSNPR
ncbi:MAG: recombinase family protein [Candidatus Omnitrophota bacterium]